MGTLIIYGSKYGSTRSIAEHIAEHLAGKGLSVDVRTPTDAVDPLDYESVIVGSAVYAGRWRRDLRQFLRAHAASLAERPLWVFSVGPLGDPPTPMDTPKDAESAMENLGARGHGLFAGALDSSQLSFGDRAMMRALSVEDGDYRNWAAISDWADHVAADLALARQ